MKNKYFGRLKKAEPSGMQSTVMFAISVISISIMLILGIVMYFRFSVLSRQEITQSTQKLMEQAGENLEDYLGSMRQISDAVYYNVIKENDLSNQDMDIQRGMNLLYEANRDNLRSIAIYNNYGSLLAAEPLRPRKRTLMSPGRTGSHKLWARWRICIFPRLISRIFLMTEPSVITG